MCDVSRRVLAVDKKKESVPTIDRQKQKDKKVAQLDEQLKNLNRDMSMVKMKSIFFVSLTLLLVFSILNNLYVGVIVRLQCVLIVCLIQI